MDLANALNKALEEFCKANGGYYRVYRAGIQDVSISIDGWLDLQAIARRVETLTRERTEHGDQEAGEEDQQAQVS